MTRIAGVFLGLLFIAPPIAGGAQSGVDGTRMNLNDGWQLNSSAVVKEEGAVISTGR